MWPPSHRYGFEVVVVVVGAVDVVVVVAVVDVPVVEGVDVEEVPAPSNAVVVVVATPGASVVLVLPLVVVLSGTVRTVIGGGRSVTPPIEPRTWRDRVSGSAVYTSSIGR